MTEFDVVCAGSAEEAPVCTNNIVSPYFAIEVLSFDNDGVKRLPKMEP